MKSGFEKIQLKTQVHSETCQLSKIGHSAENVAGVKVLIVFAKTSMLDIWQGSEYTSNEQNFGALPKINCKYYMKIFSDIIVGAMTSFHFNVFLKNGLICLASARTVYNQKSHFLFVVSGLTTTQIPSKNFIKIFQYILKPMETFLILFLIMPKNTNKAIKKQDKF